MRFDETDIQGERKKRGHVGQKERDLVGQMESLVASGDVVEAKRILNDLIQAYEAEASDIAQKLYQSGEDYDEAKSVAMWVVKKLIGLYDPNEKTILQSFIGRYLTPTSVEVRLKFRKSRELAVTNVSENILEQFIDPHSQPHIDAANREAALLRLRELIEQLPERLRYTIVRRYNLDGQGGATLEQIADELHVPSRANVGFFEVKAFKALRFLSMGDRVLGYLGLTDEHIRILLQSLGDKLKSPGRNRPVGKPSRRKSKT